MLPYPVLADVRRSATAKRRGSARSVARSVSGVCRSICVESSAKSAEEALNAIVAKGQADLRVILSGTNIGSLRGRGEVHHYCPGERDDQEQCPCYGQMADALPDAPGSG